LRHAPLDYTVAPEWQAKGIHADIGGFMGIKAKPFTATGFVDKD
jgi:hypothetical protein